MRLGEVYKKKETSNKFWLHDKICIGAFATRPDSTESIIIVDTFTDESMFFSSPSFCFWFKSEEEILEDYELYMSTEEYRKYLEDNWK